MRSGATKSATASTRGPSSAFVQHLRTADFQGYLPNCTFAHVPISS